MYYVYFTCMFVIGWNGHCREAGSSGSMWTGRPDERHSATSPQPLLWHGSAHQNGACGFAAQTHCSAG